MSDLHLHHDLYREATHRRNSEAEAWANSRALQRSARAARSHSVAPTGRRMRLTTVLSPMAALLVVLAMGAIG